MELLYRLLGFRTPGFVLYPLILYIAFQHGLWPGLAGAALGGGYVALSVLGLGRALGPEDSAAWRVSVVLVGIPAAAATIGLLRDRFNRLLVREGEARATVLRERERNAEILDSITDGVVAVDRDWLVTYANPVAEQLVGRPRDELLGQDLRKLLPGLEASVFYENYERALREQVAVHFEAASNLADIWLEVHAYPSADGLTVFFRDGTERHRHEEELRSLSLLDELTTLYNRRGFFTLAQQHCKLAERNRRGALLVFMDLDGLKQINDTLGHVAGDRAIEAVAEALRHTFRQTDILGRIGGDEFAALALETSADAAPLFTTRLQRRLEQFNAGGTISLPLSVSIGTAYFAPDQHHSIEDLLATADAHMYVGKRDKRDAQPDPATA